MYLNGFANDGCLAAVLIRELDFFFLKRAAHVCGNCFVPAAAMITCRRSATPGRLCGNPEIIEVEHYTTAAPLTEDACL